MTRKDIEIMAPVGSYESLSAAIDAGADSIYFGDTKPQDAQPAGHAVNVDASDFDEIEDDPDIPF